MPSGSAQRKKRARQRKKQEKEEELARNKRPAGIGKSSIDEEEERERERRQKEMADAKAWLASLDIEQVISEHVFNDDDVSALKAAYPEEAPFPHGRLNNFLDDQFARELRGEIKQLDFDLRNNDLYEFSQSSELKETTKPLLAKFRDVLYSEKLRSVLKDVTGIETNDHLDLFAAVYGDRQHLLCHDDRRSTRRIAFILYLVDDEADDDARGDGEKKAWTAADGGALDLFDMDANGEAKNVVKSLVPRFNAFTFFTVSPKSYHQVAEVLSKDKHRISIGGWFHGHPLPSKPLVMDPLPVFSAPSAPAPASSQESSVEDWVSREYRRAKNIKAVQKDFFEQSNIELVEFFKKDKYQELQQALNEYKEWEKVGPANKRNYTTLSTSSSSSPPSAISSMTDLLTSADFTQYISGLTGCDIISAHCKVRRFGQGDYTLAVDSDPELKNSGLDLIVSVMESKAQGKKWRDTHGGAIHYIAAGEEEELVSIFPASNSVALVYRSDGGDGQGANVMSFTQYVNNRAPCVKYEFFVTYRLAADSDDDAEEYDEDEDEDAEMIVAEE